MRGPQGRAVHFLRCFAAVLLAALLFAASFPNLLFPRGLSLLAWIAYIPLFWLSYRVTLGAAVFFGALYGCTAYGLFNYWLSVFHPLAGLIVGLIYLVYFALFLPLLRLAVLIFPRRGYILQWILWIAFEYCRTLGFLGYPYGITGYSQWYMLPLIQIAGLFGVWGVSALVVFPSAYLAAAFRNTLKAESGPAGPPWPGDFFRREWGPALLYLVALGSALIYGGFSQKDYSAAPAARIALIQHNTDPWKGGIEDYRQNFRVLKRLSEEALAADPKPDLVAWSETAFVPRIYWHQTYRDDQESYRLVRELLDYLKDQETPFIIGNDDARREISPAGVWDRVDYNGALLFHRGTLVDQYRKLRLVPFTEYFPYEKQLPWVYRALKNADTHFWKQGEDLTVFSVQDFKFSTPICFEDSFGYISRDFVKNGAEIIVNLTNDAWSGSLPAQMQHMAMSVFRAVENRRSLVRSTASGQTCGIDPNGRLLAMAEPFAELQLTLAVPIVRGDFTLYTRGGDFFARIFTVLGIIVLIMGLGRGIMKKRRQGEER